jgi:hypothetical protein
MSPLMSSVPPRTMITAKPVGELSSRTSELVAPETVSRLPGGTSMLARISSAPSTTSKASGTDSWSSPRS